MAIGILFATGLLITSKPYSGNSYVMIRLFPKPRYLLNRLQKKMMLL